MGFRAIRFDDPAWGRLWLSSMPGRFEPWSQFLADAERVQLELVLCLTPLHEIERLSPAYRAAIERGALPFRWLHVPMRDFGLPEQLEPFRDAIDTCATLLREGRPMLIHCAAGIGRTGTAAACLLKRLGLATADALQRVRDAESNPESAYQSGLVASF